MNSKIKDGFKLGFGLYFGYNIAKNLDTLAGTVFTKLKEKITKTKTIHIDQ